MLNSLRCRRIWWLGAVAIVFTLLGHDGLMASAAYAAPSPLPLTATEHRHSQPQAHQPRKAVALHPDEEQRPDHPAACGIAGVAIPEPGFLYDLASLGALKDLVGADFNEPARCGLHRWQEPFWPPRTRRALLQIYRI